MRFVALLALSLALLAPATGLAQSYTEDQLRLARTTQALYAVGVVAGVAGSAPFLGGFFSEFSSISATTSFSVLWSLEPVMMLIADDLMNRARGRERSPANIAGWILLATTIVLPLVGLVTVGENRDAGIGCAIAGSVAFFPMQILTDVLGTMAISRARGMLNQ